ncbi:DsbA family oxidoreductase [Halovivax gelatinilyticus]|uniref:DsbA family oxidoreductase n=1 Tax=Halovivax gelatinilyticus TaxID=2961597 RepID=UPI0020CA62F6|nr:DsbA family protein [Halovivax gelatinilyticus]
MSDHSDRLVVYSDHVCPFCFLGRKSVDAFESQRDEPLDLEWRPFDLRNRLRRPDGTLDRSGENGTDDASFERAQQSVDRLSAQYGVEEMRSIDDVSAIDSFPAQVASYYVAESHPDAWRAFDDAILDALWLEGRDVGEADVLANLAEDVGLDGDEIREAATDVDHRTTVRKRFLAPVREDVSSVPLFIYDGRATEGAVPPEQLARLVDGV